MLTVSLSSADRQLRRNAPLCSAASCGLALGWRWLVRRQPKSRGSTIFRLHLHIVLLSPWVQTPTTESGTPCCSMPAAAIVLDTNCQKLSFAASRQGANDNDG